MFGAQSVAFNRIEESDDCRGFPQTHVSNSKGLKPNACLIIDMFTLTFITYHFLSCLVASRIIKVQVFLNIETL